MGPNDEPPPTRILFIGNSYTSRNQLPRLLASMAAESEHPRRVEVNTVVAGGASLKRHWNAGIARQRLAESQRDYVVLQEQSTLPLKNPARYHDNVRLFHAEIARRGAKTVLYLTWARQQAPDTQDSITRAVEAIAVEVGASIVPVGPAWQLAQERHSGLRLYVDDGSHPSLQGSYLAACVFHASLFGESSEGSSVADALHLDRSVAEALQAVALECSRARRWHIASGV